MKTELLRRMAMYDRRVAQGLAAKVAKLERQLGRVAAGFEAAFVIVEDRREGKPRSSTPIRLAGARGI